MIGLNEWVVFVVACLVLVLTPGPNMVYCVSRSICQGWQAGMWSLLGVIVGMVAFVLATAIGLTAFIMVVPYAYETLKFVGAAYLLWLAWQALKPSGRSVFQTPDLPPDSRGKLFRMGLFTNLLNPKVAMFYVSFFPQFLHPELGNVFMQSLMLGATQITVSFTVNTSFILFASGIAHFFTTHPGWSLAQRYVMGTVLTGLAVRMALTDRK